MKKYLTVALVGLMLLAMSSVGMAVTLEFQQWWEVELPAGVLRGIADEFTAQTGIEIQLLSNPYADTNTQIAAGAATGTMADVVGLDGAWVYDYAKQEAISNLSALMEKRGYNDAQLSDQIKVDGATYMIPVVNFAYPMLVNVDLLKEAGVTEMPKTWSEFKAAAQAVVNNTNAYGWVIPLSTSSPSGIQNQFMSWLWASGGFMLRDGRPDLVDNEKLTKTVEFVKSLFDENLIAPGAYSMTEATMVEEFVNGRVAFMTTSLAHINLIRQGAPNLNFQAIPLPVMDGYEGQSGVVVANWGIGIAANSKYQDEAMQFIEYMMSPEVNARLAEAANAFPGNIYAEPDYSAADPVFVDSYEIFKDSYAINEFTGLPTSEHLMRIFNDHLQLYIEGDIKSVDSMLDMIQEEWVRAF
ncbi:ABC transporter substrate-binding protein [Candidatus Darwinibacter acetoxidans]|nr:sugar ABC transporter substrate-binding protein [Bacillota bacterium]